MALMTGDKTKKAYHHGDLRQALLDAAIDLITEQDIAAVSLRAIARQLGVTPAAPYHHFKDKNMLLAEVGREGFLRLAKAIDEAVSESTEFAESSPHPTTMLRAMGLGYIRFAIANPSQYRVMFGCDRKDINEYPALHEAGQSCFNRLLMSAAAALGEHSTEEDAHRVALTSWSACHGFASLWNDGLLEQKLNCDSPEEFEDQLMAMINTVIAGVCPLISHGVEGSKLND